VGTFGRILILLGRLLCFQSREKFTENVVVRMLQHDSIMSALSSRCAT
jgi:hypothetical protein